MSAVAASAGTFATNAATVFGHNIYGVEPMNNILT
jgi:hypothetical protein